MSITDPLVLPEDVVLVPVAELPEDVRRRLNCEEGDFALTRPRLRVPSRIVDPDSARLLAEFRSPTTVAEAVIRYSREKGSDPEATLTEAYPLLDRLFGAGFLVAEGEAGAAGIEASLAPGEEIAGFRVLETIQVLDDTELHQVRRQDGRTAALKLERTAGAAAGALEREAAVLAHLDGSVSPRLVSVGETEGRRYLATEWISGIEALLAAAELRQAGSREGLLALAVAVARAYARLHDEGVVHGDVHPRNVLVTAAGEAVLLDFGYARLGGWRDEPDDSGRGGVAFFFEPEYAVAMREGRRAPAASPAGEQHAVAALIYLLMTGTHYRDFSLGREEMLRQIAEEPPLPFAERGVEPWPEAEAVLGRALAKNPDERFPSLAALADAFADIAVSPPRGARPRSSRSRSRSSRPSGVSRAEALLERVIGKAGLEGTLFAETLPPPRASVKGGAAGIACALYRVALAREDAGLLSLADVWAEKAAREEGDEAYFKREGDSGILPEVVGPVSLYHSPTGTRAVQALLAHAQGNPGAQHHAANEFLAAARQPCPNPDLALGRSGVLLASALLLDTFAGDPPPPPLTLRELGEELLAGIWEEIDALPPIPRCAERPNLGVAHGWAGYLYATLQWCRAAARPLPSRTEERLRELGGCARPRGRGLCWPWYGENGEDHGVMSGWCNGSAGFVFLWTLACRQLGDPDFQALAQGAAWNAWEDPSGPANLCCGLAGRAYALLNLYKHGGGEEWLARARDLAERAALTFEQGGAETPHGLFWGEAGVAALAADLARPEGAAFPCFEEEGW
ncbi:MAG TPA: lanthionine synthetase LanC family protein [Thermoanaerobaculia bacterium]|jgi:serine/threonine-protein kinase|nr:lanthionine synthetase LanC family protein [Thermoanaerobaculia bacterium]